MVLGLLVGLFTAGKRKRRARQHRAEMENTAKIQKRSLRAAFEQKQRRFNLKKSLNGYSNSFIENTERDINEEYYNSIAEINNNLAISNNAYSSALEAQNLSIFSDALSSFDNSFLSTSGGINYTSASSRALSNLFVK